MSAAVVEDDGVQVAPQFLTVPDRASTMTDKVVAFCRTIGREHHPEQRLALEVLCGRRADGRPAARTSALICARQNLKTYVLENYVLARLVDPSDDARLFVWTAQQLTTTEETYRNFLGIFTSDQYPHMTRRFKRAKSTNGAAEIELQSGRRIKFKARSEKSGQGLTGDVIVLDEGFAVDDEHLASLIPTLATRRRAQVLWGSSAAHASSDALRAVVDRGRAGDPTLGYAEWSAAGSFAEPTCANGRKCTHERGVFGCSLDDREAIRQANPLAGVRISWETIEDERKSMSPLTFARERLGWHEAPSGNSASPITPSAWKKCADPASRFEGRPVFAIAVGRDSRSSAIAVAGWREDGRPHVEVVDYRPGDAWVIERAGQLRTEHRPRAWVVDGKTAAAALLPDLRKASVRPDEFGTTDVGAGCVTLQSRVQRGDLRHRGDNDPHLRDAVHGAGRRDIGSGMWAWSAKASEADVVPLEAATLALRKLETMPRAASTAAVTR